MTKDLSPEQPGPDPQVPEPTEQIPTSPTESWEAVEARTEETPAPAAEAAADAVPAASAAAAGAVPPPGVVPPAAPPPSGPAPGFWARTGDAWRRVWSSTLGKVAVIAAASLAVLALLAAVTLGAWASGRDDRRADAWGAGCAEQQRDGMGPGGGRGMPCGPSGKEKGNSNGNGFGHGRGKGQGNPNGMPMNPNGNGLGNPNGKGSNALPLGNVLHGEVVVGGATPRSVLYQVGEVVELTAGTSLKVRSTDGFEATYALTPTTVGRLDELATGATVRVVADKDGAKATRVVVVEDTVS